MSVWSFAAEELYKKEINQPILLSLENKDRRSVYQKWTILQEPLEDIHSLMYFSKLLISNGDSMAREGSMLRVKSIYCGIRDMKANNYLYEKNLLMWIMNIDELSDFIYDVEKSIKKEDLKKYKEDTRRKL